MSSEPDVCICHISFSSVSLQELIEEPVTVSEQQREWVCQLCTPASAAGSTGETTPMGYSLGWAGQALVCVADSKWNESIDAINKSMVRCLFTCYLLSLFTC